MSHSTFYEICGDMSKQGRIKTLKNFKGISEDAVLVDSGPSPSEWIESRRREGRWIEFCPLTEASFIEEQCWRIQTQDLSSMTSRDDDTDGVPYYQRRRKVCETCDHALKSEDVHENTGGNGRKRKSRNKLADKLKQQKI